MKEKSIKLIYKKIGERLQELRQSKKLKQEDFSKFLGISVSAYSKIETGVNELTTKHLLTLKREFNISIEWLLFGEGANDGKEFGKNEEDVKRMLGDMKSSKMVLYSMLSHYYEMIDKVENRGLKLRRDNSQ